MSDPARNAAIVDINLLPPEQRPLDVGAPVLLLGALVLIAILGLIPFAFRAHAAEENAQAMERDAQRAEESLAGMQVDLARQRALSTELGQVQAELTALQGERALFQGGQRPLAEDLAQVWEAAASVPGLQIGAITSTATGFRVDGSASGPLDVVALTNTLVSANGFPAATMSAYTPAAGTARGQFSVEVTR
jgi:hypothetical protein